ncbi:GNAT family N-acetyltransferase [Sinisalibacter aestuarii]|uniref:N-acetyltransferase n=1 Tax=Sinisalibacter aestuarii TaxID=2949426 RepID=A0ABQ5LU21_9RHOB|nr:GNAT family N-acetyltransferase [Sinisalibacter aestuarii]GKY88463.1 N-acetyltransferase [Sinisalibacter aestuarii]
MTLRVEVTDSADADDVARIGAELAAFNNADVGPSEKVALTVLVRDDRGDLAAGLSGYTAWGWLYVQWLWVSEGLRGQGIAARMLDEAEAAARARGCHGAWIDTFSPTALRSYQRQGYAVFGELPDFPAGRRRSFLKKAL